jgi:hypothetical protein
MGQKSAVDKLPEKLRAKLLEMLQNPAVTQAEIVDAINAEAGKNLLSRSSVNRYAQRMKKFAEKNRQAREVADAYLEKVGADSRNKLGKIVNEQIRLAAYDLMLDIEDIKDDPEVDAKAVTDILLKVSKSLRELEQAEKLNAERTAAIRQETLAEAVAIMEQEAESAGLTGDTLEKIKKRILGL